MNKKRTFRKTLPIAIVLVLASALVLLFAGDSETKESQEKNTTLNDLGRVYSVYQYPNDQGRIYLATKGGIVMAGLDGVVRPVSSIKGEFYTFAFQATDPKKILAGGADENGKTLGLLLSGDGGHTWHRTNGDMMFFDLERSPLNSSVIYALTDRGLVMSKDRGGKWSNIGAPPARVFDLALSPSQADTIYAATMKGLFASRNGGLKWEKIHKTDNPVTTVYVSKDGRVYAFFVDAGLVNAKEGSLSWNTINSAFQDRVLIRMAGSSTNPNALFTISDTSTILYSRNGGASWESFEGNHMNTAKRISSGRGIYNENCQKCHGPNGIGEPPENIKGADMAPAPPLNNSAHAWHHPNDDIIETILEGSEREGSRMVAWKDKLSRTDAEDVLVYIKSLWSIRSIACQGSRHMACMK